MGGFLGALGGMEMDRLKNSGAGQMAGAYNRYRMGQAQGDTNDAVNQDMTNRMGHAGGMFSGRQDGSNVEGNEPGGENGEYGAYGQNPDAAIPDNMPAMAKGGVVDKPTVALLGEHGPEAVVPLNNPNAKVTPGMFSHHRYRPQTGKGMVHGPMRPMAPAALDDRQKESNWRKFDSEHPRL